LATKYDIAALSDLQQIALTPSDDIRRYNAEFGKTEFGRNDLRLVKAELVAIAKLWKVVVPKSMTTKLLRKELLALAGRKTSKKATKVAKKSKVTNDSIRNKAPELVTSNSPQLDSIESTMKQLAASMEAMTAALAAISAKS